MRCLPLREVLDALKDGTRVFGRVAWFKALRVASAVSAPGNAKTPLLTNYPVKGKT